MRKAADKSAAASTNWTMPWRTVARSWAPAANSTARAEATSGSALKLPAMPRKVWALCRCRHKQHYAEAQIMPMSIGNPASCMAITTTESA